jgi:hypothetical protein
MQIIPSSEASPRVDGTRCPGCSGLCAFRSMVMIGVMTDDTFSVRFPC